MASIILYFFLTLLAALVFYIIRFQKKLKYFKDRGITQLKPEFLYGDAREILEKKLFQGEFYRNVYTKFKKLGVKHGGIYVGSKRVWIPVDPELIKAIMLKDFISFSDHYPKLPKQLDTIFFKNVFFMVGDEWRDMRKKLTPAFTTGKMKMMFDILLEKSDGLIDLVSTTGESGEAVEIKEILGRFTTDVIGSCGFGIECSSMKDKNSEFFLQAQSIFMDHQEKPTLFGIILSVLGLKMMFGIGFFKPIESFFRNVVEEAFKYREKNKFVRKDFLHLMIQLKNKGMVTEMTNESDDVYTKTVDKEVISMDEISAQCLVFFSAGFETSSTTMSFALLELTQYPDIQQKIRKEVREVLQRHDGKLTYDALQEMTYLENVVQETLRKYPPVATIPRNNNKSYNIPGTDIVIEKDTTVNISVWGLHMDPDYFPEPHKFIPERFNSENKSKIKDMTYIPFGEGPRMCLGLRFGMMQSKAGLATLLNSYNFTLDKRTPYPPVYQTNQGIATIVAGGVWLKATKVE